MIGSGIYQYINKDIVFFIEGIGLLLTIMFIMFFIRIDNEVSTIDLLKN